MIESTSSFARAADVVIDVLREMLDELRGMRTEVTQGLTGLKTEVVALHSEMQLLQKRMSELGNTPPPRRNPAPAHGTKRSRRPARR